MWEYVFALLTHVAMESFASENAARLAAMQSARDKLEKRLSELRTGSGACARSRLLRSCSRSSPMPMQTKVLLEDQGTAFENFFISYPWCCPSRASILRGQYSHNTHIVGNEPPWGGFETFRRLGLEESTVATWLHDAGYRTAMVGK